MSRAARTVVVDCFPERAHRYVESCAIVAVDVIRATTTAVTAVALGRRCFPVPSIEAAVPTAARLDNPLLVGELGGSLPYGFHLNNSPSALSARDDVERPAILLSTSGTRLLDAAAPAEATYAACLRNWSATVERLAARHAHVAVLGAGSRGEFREEDQLCCAWIAEGLIAKGYEAWDDRTVEVVERWSGASTHDFDGNKSAEYLRETGQADDLAFVHACVDDLDLVCALVAGELVVAP